MADNMEQDPPVAEQQQQQQQHQELSLLSYDKKHNICAFVGMNFAHDDEFGDLLTFIRCSENWLVMNRSKKFLMYPRFIRLIIRDLIPDLVIDQTLQNDVMVLEHMTADIVRRMKIYRQDPHPPTKRLIGHLEGPGGNDGEGNDNNGGDGDGGDPAQQQDEVEAPPSIVAPRKREGKEVAGEGFSKRRVSTSAGISFGVQPPRLFIPQRPAVPLTSSTPELTLTTTLTSDPRLGMIPQSVLSTLPRPTTATSVVSPTPTMMPPPPMDFSFLRLNRPQGPVQPIPSSFLAMTHDQQMNMVLSLLHLYENQMSADRMTQECMMDNQRRLMGYVSYCQKETKEFREIVKSKGVKIKEQEDLILQLTCKDDALKKLKNNDEDPDASGTGGSEPKQTHGSSSGVEALLMLMR
ncbi:uncharacterized protein LOC143576163 [Bidens hawaiensis]|uniref:uncharacterized protein LOC143576163 n=1 Tax=Bidens hawaiensis TaxID=980011 RepID=UPI004049A795